MQMKISVSKIGILYRALLIVAGGLTLGYSWLGWMGAGFGWPGEGEGMMAYVLIIQPLFAFPLFLLVFVSLRLTVCLLWVYIAATVLVYVVDSWPVITLVIFSSRADRWLFTAVVLTQVAYILKGREQRL
jgi:hypothetical protein